ncbi:hypothetical protein ABPG75_013020 [Micractinium tetrahymenae]
MCLECSALFPGFTKKCQRCADPLCGYCDDSPTNCTGCLDGSWNTQPDGSYRGTYMDRAGRCQLCPKGCERCSVTKAGVVCEQCSMRYRLVGGACQRCKDPLCLSCTDTTNRCDVDSCDMTSPAGLPVYRNSAGMCVEGRIKGCEEYRADGRCKACAYGYLLRNNQCVV